MTQNKFFNNRRNINILTLIIYAAAQFSTTIPAVYYKMQGYSYNEITQKSIAWLPPAFVVASLIIIFLHLKIKNPTDLENGRKTPWGETLIWMFAGIFLAMFSQMIMGMINVYLLKQPLESENTKHIMDIARQIPIFIILISIFGPILEEFVFRKVIFGELYQLIKGNRVIAFIISGLISGFIFSLAHADFNHTLIYMGMAFVFSGLYVATKRLIVPIFAHAAMNTFVVMIQLTLGDKIETMRESVKPTTQLILHIIFK